MLHVTQHTPKVSTGSFNLYDRESSREKRQQDRRLERQTESQLWSYLDVDFLHDANTSIDMKVKRGLKQANTSMSHDSLFQPFLLPCQYDYWHPAKNRV